MQGFRVPTWRRVTLPPAGYRGLAANSGEREREREREREETARRRKPVTRHADTRGANEKLMRINRYFAAIIGGVITSTLLTLLVIPTFYDILAGMRDRTKRLFGRGERRGAHPRAA